jgi:hypothetical protein
MPDRGSTAFAKEAEGRRTREANWELPARVAIKDRSMPKKVRLQSSREAGLGYRGITAFVKEAEGRRTREPN